MECFLKKENTSKILDKISFHKTQVEYEEYKIGTQVNES